MKIKCIALKMLDSYPHSMSYDYDPETVFNLNIGEEYIVYAMSLYKGLIFYLLDTKCFGVSWYPFLLFSVTDGRMPSAWKFSTNDSDHRYYVAAIWGYDELIEDQGHYDALVDGNQDAMLIFANRRKEIENEEKMN